MIKRALVIPDCHIPYQDQSAYELMLAVAKDLDPDELVILGDYADFFAINSHGKDADMVGVLLMDEVQEVIAKLEELVRLFPNAKKVFCEGNHEYRLTRYLSQKAPDLFGVVDVPSILELDRLGFQYVPYGPNQKYNILGSKLIARHSPLAGGKHVAMNTAEKAMCSVIFGHTHRIQEAQIVTISGENYRGISSGWLGDKNSKVMQYVKNHHQWALGFSIVSVLEDGTWFNTLTHIIDDKCMYNGYLYEN
jgi:UDP-2,3-diacylglucosamine pyrophosphatase LpxH